MKQRVKFFQICAVEGYLYGLDGDGRVWVAREDEHSHLSWEVMLSPEIEIEQLDKKDSCI